MKHQANTQVEPSQNSPQLWDQVELHDLTKQRVVPGRMSLELKVQVGWDREREQEDQQLYLDATNTANS